VDLPGHGNSAWSHEHACLSDYTNQIAELVGDLDSSVFVVGHSLGAMIALDFASQHPELCRGVAALNAIFRRSSEATDAVRERAATLAGDDPVDPTSTLARWFGREPSEANRAAAEACKRWLLRANRTGYANAYRVFAHEDGPTAEALSSLTSPALFVTGAEDRNSTPAMSEAMAALAPLGESIVIAGAAHMMPMTHVNEVNDVLSTFLGQRGDTS
jgi:pimeloyl-ACP methyl ester carboxylesterase